MEVRRMSVDGKGNITINSPMGPQKATLDLKANGGALTGTQAGQQGSVEIANGKADCNNASSAISIPSPLPLTLGHSGMVISRRDSLDVTPSPLPSFPFFR